jgi:hypothetical protein
MQIRRTAAALTSAAALSVTGVAMATPAQAAPVITGGLVNVTVTEVIDDITVVVQDVNVAVGAALGIAANVCDVNVNVLAEQLRSGGATCTSDASGQTVTIDQV